MYEKSSQSEQDIVPDSLPPSQNAAYGQLNVASGALPPSFAQSEFETIIRRQRTRLPHKLKLPHSRPPPRALHMFAGWGSMSYVELTPAELTPRAPPKVSLMGQLRASSISGNGVVGSVFYAFPAVAAASLVFSPLSLLVACLLLTVFRPLFLELAGAIRLNGANYVYLLQTSGKAMGMVGAAATLLDAIATSTVSAATAANYIHGEFPGMPITEAALAVCFLVALSLVALFSLRESSGFTLSITIIHLITMTALFLASIIAWAHTGSDILRANWSLRPQGTVHILRAIFDGICIGFLGVTGFECTPSYVQAIRPDAYPAVLRNLLISATVLNAPLMLVVFALLPSEVILGGANVLSILASVAAGSSGRWLRWWVVVDCVLVLGGGVLAGVFTACGLLERLAKDRVIPQTFLRTMPLTGSAYVSVLAFLALSLLVYASSGLNLAVISGMFSITFLFVMGLYAVSAILLKVNADRLPRQYRARMSTALLALAVTIIVLFGNVVRQPITIGLFAAYFFAILLTFFVFRTQVQLAQGLMWLSTHLSPPAVLTNWIPWKATSYEKAVAGWIQKLRKNTICVWVKTHDIHVLLSALLYVKRNESTARVIFVHAYSAVEQIPAELDANSRILDEAFPDTTIDLVFLNGTFGPTLVNAASIKLAVDHSQMLMFCPGQDHLSDYGGVRIMNV
ncbi:hypothetical protein BOTBODRAFT_65898 [Botryobasidium botryosum FD-172 SS1]|uniref:Amino acid permease/ SLC12A domain-containing protein n=1 Tax=Botryobasidium botryosum (strain FD-172 SS1) TaxID=930990 RepID=A0A067MTS5_BOTB1|nr:hypothetical protein BOTBODRAFT_65898 [Botryobasidium botryosum FD-172 SS1]